MNARDEDQVRRLDRAERRWLADARARLQRIRDDRRLSPKEDR